MNESLEETASLYVLDQLDPRERTAFEARLFREPKLAALRPKLEAAMDIRRSLRKLHATLNKSAS